jgi:hypothetical protein
LERGYWWCNLTDAELRSAIIYMFNKGTVPPKAQ